ncbi:TPA: ead/Ea22-like family protein [Raoultella ornithinolytica]
MTDITELAQSLKAAAEKATPGNWRYLKTTPFMDAEISAANHARVVNLLAGDVTEANSAFIALANPANILALVEAMEEAQRANNSAPAILRQLAEEKQKRGEVAAATAFNYADSALQKELSK